MRRAAASATKRQAASNDVERFEPQAPPRADDDGRGCARGAGGAGAGRCLSRRRPPARQAKPRAEAVRVQRLRRTRVPEAIVPPRRRRASYAPHSCWPKRVRVCDAVRALSRRPHATPSSRAAHPMSAELCFIGEGPGAEEDAQGEPVRRQGRPIPRPHDRRRWGTRATRFTSATSSSVDRQRIENRSPNEMAACFAVPARSSSRSSNRRLSSRSARRRCRASPGRPKASPACAANGASTKDACPSCRRFIPPICCANRRREARCLELTSKRSCASSARSPRAKWLGGARRTSRRASVARRAAPRRKRALLLVPAHHATLVHGPFGRVAHAL